MEVIFIFSLIFCFENGLRGGLFIASTHPFNHNHSRSVMTVGSIRTVTTFWIGLYPSDHASYNCDCNFSNPQPIFWPTITWKGISVFWHTPNVMQMESYAHSLEARRNCFECRDHKENTKITTIQQTFIPESNQYQEWKMWTRRTKIVN